MPPSPSASITLCFQAAKIGAERLRIDDAVAGKHAGARLPGDFERNESHGINIALVILRTSLLSSRIFQRA